MSWKIQAIPEAVKDLDNLDGSQRKIVLKALEKVRQNPVSEQEGGYGKPLGKRNNIDLSGYYKIKLKASGLRIVYKLERKEDTMILVVVGLRADNEVYELAKKRISKHFR